MKTDNLTELIELLTEPDDTEPDPRLEDGQVLALDGTIVTLQVRSLSKRLFQRYNFS